MNKKEARYQIVSGILGAIFAIVLMACWMLYLEAT